ncbi:MAG TPA: vitamin K epoxide reductase family protein [Jatrophihabitans sp.]|nr:vitamin K epoxide reductase family protein [Jatrophihabitans sp.]
MADRSAPRIGLGSFAVALSGLAIAAYLTVEHYVSSVTLACPATGTINCAKVTTSAWSHVGPVPLAVLGLCFFAAMTALCAPSAWRVRALAPIRIAGSTAGVGFAIYLVWVELFRLDAICLWCTAVHACTVVLLATVLWTTGAIPHRLKGQNPRTP